MIDDIKMIMYKSIEMKMKIPLNSFELSKIQNIFYLLQKYQKSKGEENKVYVFFHSVFKTNF